MELEKRCNFTVYDRVYDIFLSFKRALAENCSPRNEPVEAQLLHKLKKKKKKKHRSIYRRGLHLFFFFFFNS